MFQLGSGYLKHVFTVFDRIGYMRGTPSSDWDVLWCHDYPFITLHKHLINLKPHQRVRMTAYPRYLSPTHYTIPYLYRTRPTCNAYLCPTCLKYLYSTRPIYMYHTCPIYLCPTRPYILVYYIHTSGLQPFLFFFFFFIMFLYLYCVTSDTIVRFSLSHSATIIQFAKVYNMVQINRYLTRIQVRKMNVIQW